MHCHRCKRYRNVSCVVSQGGSYYALYVNDKLFRPDLVVIKRISKARYHFLRRHGVKRCRVLPGGQRCKIC